MGNNFHDKLKNNVCKVICNESHGTGFLISDKLVLTAYHVIADCDEIKVVCSNNNTLKATLHKFIEEKYKALDIALLELTEPVTYEQIDMIDCPLAPKTNWLSRGYPESKSDSGENLIHDDNRINDQLKELKNGKIDLNLDLHQKLTKYNGLSGAPIVVNENIVGIINSQLDEHGIAKELNGLSVQYFKKLLESVDIDVIEEYQKHLYHSGISIDNLALREKIKTIPTAVQSYEIRYAKQLTLAYNSDKVTNNFTNIEDFKNNSQYDEHFKRARESFYNAEQLRNFSRDNLGQEVFDDFQEEIYQRVVDIGNDENKNGFKKVIEAEQKAMDLPIESNPLKARCISTDKKGICHQLVNDNRITWIKDDE